MKLSVQDKLSRHVTVLLDGIDVTTECQMADEDNGVVECFDRDENGKIKVDGWRDTAFKIVSGRVEITIRDNAPGWAKNEYEAMRGKEVTA